MARKKQEEPQPSNSHLERILSNKKFDSLRPAVVDAKNVVPFKDKISTGSIIFDAFLGAGFRPGIARISGNPELGKTSCSLCWGAQWQKTIPNSCVIYVNAEGRLTDGLLENSQLDLSPGKFRSILSNKFEDIAQLVNDLVLDNPEPSTRYFFIIDSTDALICKADEEKSFDEFATVAGSARMASAFTKRTSINIGSRGHFLMLLSQVRASMSSRGPGGGGTTESGGKALTFYSSLTMKIDSMWSDLMIFPGDDSKRDPLGHYFSLKIQKSFVDQKHKKIQIPIKYGRKGGVWTEMECFDLSLMYGIAERKGAWYNMDKDILKSVDIDMPEAFQGKWKFINYLEENPKVTKQLEKHFRETLIGDEGKVALLAKESESPEAETDE